MTPYRTFLTRAITAAATCMLVGAIAAALAPVATAAGATRYVATTGSDAGDCSAGSAPCLTIGYALTQAADDDTIAIGAGTFDENLTISKSVTLAGTGEGATILRNDDAGVADATVTVATGAATVVISGVTVSHASPSTSPAAHGVLVTADAIVTIDSSTVELNGGDGARVSAGSLAVDSSTISRNQQTGIVATGGTSAVTVDGSTIEDNLENGLQLIDTIGSVTNSTISENGASEVGGSGITFHAFNKNLNVTDSLVTDNGRNGIAVSGGTAVVAASTLADNGSSGIYVNAPIVTFRAPGRALLSPSASASPPVRGASVRMPRPEAITDPCAAVTINQSRLTGNHEFGAAVYTGSLNVNFSTLSANVAGGIHAGNLSCATTVVKSTASGNGGPGVDAEGTSIDVTASTVANNASTGIAIGSGTSPAQIYQSTIAGNAGAAGGLDYTGRTTVSVGATIIANNSPLDCAAPVSPGVITDAGYNLSGDASCGFSATAHSIPNGDPKLAPLADNGGSTQTLALGDGSDALDKIPDPTAAAPPATSSEGEPLRAAGAAFAQSIPGDIGATCLAGLSTDQRGIARPQNGRCDIGAYERVPRSHGGTSTPTPTPTPTSTSAPSSTVISSRSTTATGAVQASSTPASTATVLGASAHAPARTTIAVAGLAQTGVGVDRFAAAGLLLLTIGAMLLVALTKDESDSRH